MFTDDFARSFSYIAAVTVIALMVLGAGVVYLILSVKGHPAPDEIIVFLVIALNQIAVFLVGKRQNTIKDQTNGKMLGMENRINEKIEGMK